MPHFFKKKLSYPAAWPDLDAPGNPANFKLVHNQLQFEPLTATVIYDEKRLTAAQTARLLSLFKPQQKEAFLVPLASDLAAMLFRRLRLHPGCYVLFADLNQLEISTLFLAPPLETELATAKLESVAMQIDRTTMPLNQLTKLPYLDKVVIDLPEPAKLTAKQHHWLDPWCY